MKIIDPDTMEFDEEELGLIDAYKNGRLESNPINEQLIRAAAETIKKNKNINIRINENDLTSIKLMAAREGIPYQTLIGSVLHKYTSGILKEVA